MSDRWQQILVTIGAVALIAFVAWITYQRYLGCMEIFDSTKYCLFGG